MITQVICRNKQYQAYKETSIIGNVIIEVFELVKFKGINPNCAGGFSHKFIGSRAIDLKSNTDEDNPVLLQKANEFIQEVSKND